MKGSLLCLIVVLFYSCSSITNVPESQLRSDYYESRHPGTRYSRVYVDVKEDSLVIIPIDKNKTALTPTKEVENQILVRKSFDVDVLTVPFKFRPSVYNFPRQLTVDFNGSIFLGYRFDRYKVLFNQTPVGVVKKLRHRALTMGVFGGVGTTAVNPWTTNYRTTDEYNGFIFNRGISLMGGVNNLTVGVGLGWDYLTDRDKEIWIYQNKPWFGLTLSLNLN
jgi:hypothetical protein